MDTGNFEKKLLLQTEAFVAALLQKGVPVIPVTSLRASPTCKPIYPCNKCLFSLIKHIFINKIKADVVTRWQYVRHCTLCTFYLQSSKGIRCFLYELARCAELQIHLRRQKAHFHQLVNQGTGWGGKSSFFLGSSTQPPFGLALILLNIDFLRRMSFLKDT